jgi:hypothetical protein
MIQDDQQQELLKRQQALEGLPFSQIQWKTGGQQPDAMQPPLINGAFLGFQTTPSAIAQSGSTVFQGFNTAMYPFAGQPISKMDMGLQVLKNGQPKDKQELSPLDRLRQQYQGV